MMPGILVGWRDDWMARDAGEVVEVVETGLSANSLATRRVVWIPSRVGPITGPLRDVGRRLRDFEVFSSHSRICIQIFRVLKSNTFLPCCRRDHCVFFRKVHPKVSPSPTTPP